MQVEVVAELIPTLQEHQLAGVELVVAEDTAEDQVAATAQLILVVVVVVEALIRQLAVQEDLALLLSNTNVLLNKFLQLQTLP